MRRITLALAVLVMATVAGSCVSDARETTTTQAGPTSTSTTTSIPATTSTVESTTTTTSATGPIGDLLVVGDWGSGTLPQGAVAGAMERYANENDINAILTTGDNLYSDDWEFLVEPYGWATESSVPFWITWGNHDVESETRIAAVDEAFDDPPRWALHEWGAVDVIVLDSNQITSPEQASFFLETMEDSNDPTIVAMHHPPYSCAHYEWTTDLVHQVVEILDDDVLLVLSGHEHVYQRFERDGVSYVVSGGGGATTRELSECAVNHPDPIAGESIHHFLALEQTSSSIQVSAFDVNGEGVDEFVVSLP